MRRRASLLNGLRIPLEIAYAAFDALAMPPMPVQWREDAALPESLGADWRPAALAGAAWRVAPGRGGAIASLSATRPAPRFLVLDLTRGLHPAARRGVAPSPRTVIVPYSGGLEDAAQAATARFFEECARAEAWEEQHGAWIWTKKLERPQRIRVGKNTSL